MPSLPRLFRERLCRNRPASRHSTQGGLDAETLDLTKQHSVPDKNTFRKVTQTNRNKLLLKREVASSSLSFPRRNTSTLLTATPRPSNSPAKPSRSQILGMF
ncbi:hypothetical protein OUZ56_027458 [Daphnia magna]|uniref:Uncharacterized protein n=1 Tax=Daphnia magna TaxID=35525 RepID=A0ABQ9ZPU5_9CRUS|nr:hypothetical protein OUZ56_027458 [Daphnia magna]